MVATPSLFNDLSLKHIILPLKHLITKALDHVKGRHTYTAHMHACAHTDTHTSGLHLREGRGALFPLRKFLSPLVFNQKFKLS